MTKELKCGEYSNYITNTKEVLDGIQYIFEFENNYGASVVKFAGTYGYANDLWELGVLYFDDDGYCLTYDTPITNDVIGYLTDEGVCAVLKNIKSLED